MLPDLKESWNIPGIWTVHYSNQDSISCAGKLYFEHNDKLYLKLIIDSISLKNISIHDSIDKLSIDRIVGKTQEGTFFLFDSFQYGSKFGYTIVEYNILSNISCLVSSNLTITDEYREHDDIKSENDDLFYDGYIMFTELFSWILQNSYHIDNGHLYKICEHCNSEQLINRYFEWTEVKLNDDILLKFNVCYKNIEFIGCDTIRTPNVSVSVNTDKPHSIRFFTMVTWSLKYILSMLTDTYIVIERIDLSKKFNNDDKYREFHRLFFIEGEPEANSRLDYPINFETKSEFNSYIIKSFELHKNYPDFFINMSKYKKSSSIEESIIILAQTIDASFEFLYGYIETSDYIKNIRKRLKDVLSPDKFSAKERGRIIGDACRVSLTDKLKLCIDKAFKILGIPYGERIAELLEMAKTIRNKQSHGNFYKHFAIMPVSFDDMRIVSTILKNSIYVLFLHTLGTNDERIRKAFRDKTKRALAKYYLRAAGQTPETPVG
jgi:hypothetical protein